MHDSDSDASAMLRKVMDIVERQRSENASEGSTTLVRRTEDTLEASDDVSSTTESSTAWDWSSDSTWGFDEW